MKIKLEKRADTLTVELSDRAGQGYKVQLEAAQVELLLSLLTTAKGAETFVFEMEL